MTPRDLRAEIPALADVTYLNYGASGPSPRSVVRAAEAFLSHHAFDAPGGEGMYPAAFDTYEEVRASIAAFIEAADAEVALTQSTADGINRFAGAIDWQPGDVVVRTDMEHPAGILPWERLARVHDVEVRVIRGEDGRIEPEAFAAAVDGARLAVFSALTWNYGTRQPVAELVDQAQAAGALTLVDAVQLPGQASLDVGTWGADAVAAAGHKWLLGPWGAGVLYVDHDVAEALRPAQVGYRSVESPTDAEPRFRGGATRFEVGTTTPAPYVGAEAAIDAIDAVGFDTIESRIERLTDRLKAGLGDRLLSPEAYESGLVTFTAGDPEATVERLADEDVYVRTLPHPDAVRASVHVFNTEADVDALLSALTQ